MLRIGKNENEQPEKQEGTAFNASRNFAQPEPAVKSAVENANSSRALTESETLARDIKEGTLSGYVGSGTVLTGETTFKAMMRVDGQLSGRVTSSSGTLIVGTGGRVDANIDVAVATIHGTVNGDILATQRLELGRAAKVTGNIQSPSLVIEQGAIFEGSCKMTQAGSPATSTSNDKGKRPFKPEDQVLDTTRMKPVSADGKPNEIASISEVAS